MMSRLRKIFRALSPSCQEAVRLQSEALDHQLPLLRRIGLRVHLVLCRWCARYAKQLQLLRRVAQHCEPDPESKQTLPPAARERIKRVLKNHDATGDKNLP